MIFLFLSISLFAQVDIDGLVVTSKYKIPEGFESFLQLDYNNDKLTDIVVYGKNSKEYILFNGDQKLTFKKPTERFYFYPLTDLAKLRDRKKLGNVKLFISRAERIAGLSAFTNYGTLQLLTQIKLDSYPDNIVTGDFDKNGSNEAILFGLNFNGIELIREKKLSLESTKIVKNKIFKSVFPIDLDYDGYPDLVALDLLENGITIFINDKTGSFYKQRTLNYHLNINDINLADPNRDGFTDIVIYTENSIDAFRGDSVYSFGETYNILKNTSSELLCIDNTSLSNDANFFLYNNTTSSLDYYKQQTGSQEYAVYPVLRDSGITKVEKLEGSSKYVAHSKKGWLYILEKLTPDEKVSFYPGHEFNTITLKGNNNETFVALYDTSAFQARLYKIDDNLIPCNFFESNLNYHFNRLDYLYYEQNNLFVLWRYGEKVIEIFTITNERIVKREYIYSRLPVTRMKLYYSGVKSDVNLMLYGGTNGNILSENITLNSKVIEDLPLNFVDSNIVALVPDVKEYLALHAWKKEADSLVYQVYKPGNISKYSTDQLLEFPDENNIAGFFELSENGSLTLIESEGTIKALVFDNEKFSSLKIAKPELLKRKSNFRFFESENQFLITCDDGKKLYSIRNDKTGLKVSEIKGIELKNINDYFIFSIRSNWYIAYLDKNYFVNIERMNEK